MALSGQTLAHDTVARSAHMADIYTRVSYINTDILQLVAATVTKRSAFNTKDTKPEPATTTNPHPSQEKEGNVS